MMGYNIRVLEYHNADGSVKNTQIRVYDRPIPDMQPDNTQTHKFKFREPFEGTLVYDMDKQEISRRESAARARRKISMYAQAASWEWFITLTFAPKK